MTATLTAYYNREPKELIVKKPEGDWFAFGQFLKSLGFRRVCHNGHPVPGEFYFLTGNSYEFDQVIEIVKAGGEYLTSCNFESTAVV